MTQHRIPPKFLMCLMIFTLIFPACGKKDDPMPPQVKVPAIAHLDAKSDQNGILLGWSLDGPPDRVARFRFVRSEIAPGNPVCAACPQIYHPHVTVAIADDHLQRKGGQVFGYLDTDVRTGSYYFYRISACDRGGHCGDISNEAGVRYTVP